MIERACLQIISSEQSAKCMVYCYPYWPKHERMLEQLVKERGEPSMQALLEDTLVDDIQHAANWQEIVNYLASITMDNIHDHVPLLS